MQQLAKQLSDVLDLPVELPWRGQLQQTLAVFARLLLLYDESWKVNESAGLTAVKQVLRYLSVMGVGHLCSTRQHFSESHRLCRVWSALLDRVQQKHGHGLYSRLRKVLRQKEISEARRQQIHVQKSQHREMEPLTRQTPFLAYCSPQPLHRARTFSSVISADTAANGTRPSRIPVLVSANAIPSGRQLARTPCASSRQRRSSTGPSLALAVTPRRSSNLHRSTVGVYQNKIVPNSAPRTVHKNVTGASAVKTPGYDCSKSNTSVDMSSMNTSAVNQNSFSVSTHRKIPEEEHSVSGDTSDPKQNSTVASSVQFHSSNSSSGLVSVAEVSTAHCEVSKDESFAPDDPEDVYPVEDCHVGPSPSEQIQVADISSVSEVHQTSTATVEEIPTTQGCTEVSSSIHRSPELDESPSVEVKLESTSDHVSVTEVEPVEISTVTRKSARSNRKRRNNKKSDKSGSVDICQSNQGVSNNDSRAVESPPRRSRRTRHKKNSSPLSQQIEELNVQEVAVGEVDDSRSRRSKRSQHEPKTAVMSQQMEELKLDEMEVSDVDKSRSHRSQHKPKSIVLSQQMEDMNLDEVEVCEVDDTRSHRQLRRRAAKVNYEEKAESPKKTDKKRQTRSQRSKKSGSENVPPLEENVDAPAKVKTTKKSKASRLRVVRDSV